MSPPKTADELVAEIVQRLREIDACDESWSGVYSRAARRIEAEFTGRYRGYRLAHDNAAMARRPATRCLLAWDPPCGLPPGHDGDCRGEGDGGDCTHERTRFPERPVPDAWYPCPDCGERVARRGGRIITVAENNAAIEAKRRHDEWAVHYAGRMHEALEEIAAMDPPLREACDTTPGDVARAALTAAQGGEDR